jgi:hypothetical protein
VSQHHGAEAAVISSALVTSKAQTYLLKISSRRRDVAVRVGLRQADRAGEGDEPIAATSRHARPSASRSPTLLALDRLDQRVRGVDPDEHEHEEEQHHDGAGVDEDLHDAEEVGSWTM